MVNEFELMDEEDYPEEINWANCHIDDADFEDEEDEADYEEGLVYEELELNYENLTNNFEAVMPDEEEEDLLPQPDFIQPIFTKEAMKELMEED